MQLCPSRQAGVLFQKMKSKLLDLIPSRESLSRVAENMPLPEREKRPLVVAFYLTFDCNARCKFCSQAKYVYGEAKGNYAHVRRDIERAKEILRVIRRDVPNIYFEGGEPTIYPGFEEILAECKSLEFETIAVNTNAIKFSPAVLEYADLLVVSMHSDDPRKVVEIYEIAGGIERGAEIIDNIARYNNMRDKKKTRMVINCVATAENLTDIAEVASFAQNLGVQFNLAPSIQPDGTPDPALIDNPDYQLFVDWMMRQGMFVAASQNYLRTIRNFEPFICAPHLVPGVHPDGRMIVPCPNLPEAPEMVNILEAGGVIEGLRIGREKFEAQHGILDTARRCADRCHKMCFVDTSGTSSIAGIMTMVQEGVRGFRRQLAVKDKISNRAPPHLRSHSACLCDPYYDKFAPWMPEGTEAWLNRRNHCPADTQQKTSGHPALRVIEE